MTSEQYQALIDELLQQKQRSPWLDLATTLGPSLLQGAGEAAASSAQRKQELENQAYGRRQQARSGLAAFYAQQGQQQRDAAQSLANAMPLGAEQGLAEMMGRRRALGQVAAGWQPPRGMSPAANAFAAQTPNLLAGFASPDYQQTVSREATARSIAERRKALAGLDPNFQFGSMGDYGVPDLGGEVSQYATGVQGRRQQSENELLRLLTEQMREASGAQVPGATDATAAAGQSKKTPWWRKAIGAALPVAAAFIPGVGPAASIALQAAAGAAGGAIGGGGVKGAVLGGLMGGVGAGTGGLGSAAGRQAMAQQGVKSFAKQTLSNPRLLTQIAGGALGGDKGAALQLASLSMPGAQGGGGGRPGFEATSGIQLGNGYGQPLDPSKLPGFTTNFQEPFLPAQFQERIPELAAGASSALKAAATGTGRGATAVRQSVLNIPNAEELAMLMRSRGTAAPSAANNQLMPGGIGGRDTIQRVPLPQAVQRMANPSQAAALQLPPLARAYYESLVRRGDIYGAAQYLSNFKPGQQWR